MKQIVHIFLKDVRHFWVEISIALAAVIAQFWLPPFAWAYKGPANGAVSLSPLATATLLLTPLMLIAWLLLIVRSVQDERLVGDRQFWLTRPYDWKKLLAAKLLFFAAFIGLPFFVLQCVMLARAGFSPLPWTPRILLDLVLIGAAMILPLAAIASVTASFGRMMLVLVGVLLYLLIGLVVSVVVNGLPRELETLPVQIEAYLADLLFLLACAAALILQYKRHRIVLSRLLLIGVFVAAGALDLIAPDRLLINRNYPAVSSQSIAPLAVSLIDYGETGPVSSYASHDKSVDVDLALDIAGVEVGSAVRVDAVKAAFETPDGFQWASGWQFQEDWITKDPGRTVGGISLLMPERVYARLKNVSSSLKLTVALTQLKTGNEIEIPLPRPNQEFSVPGFGICTPLGGIGDDAPALACRFPFQAPLTLVSARWFDRPCAQSRGDPGTPGSGWVGSLSHDAPRFALIPVQEPAFPLSNSVRTTPNGWAPRNLCLGTPVTFTRYELMRRERVTMAADSFRLRENSNPADSNRAIEVPRGSAPQPVN